MTAYHLFYIPLVLLVGTVIGFNLGRRAAAAEAAAEARKASRREARRRLTQQEEGGQEP